MENTSTCMTPAAFNALPRATRAVMIARDVIAQLKAKQIIAKRGSYISGLGNLTQPQFKDISVASESGRKLIAQSNCHVCAKGALFLATIQRTNAMTIGGMLEVSYAYVDDNWQGHRKNPTNIRITEKVVKEDRIFTRKEFDLMEAAFECSSDFGRSLEAQKVIKYGLNFGTTFLATPSTLRLVAICLNIIKNKGNYVPNKNPKPEDVRRAFFGRNYKKSAEYMGRCKLDQFGEKAS